MSSWGKPQQDGLGQVLITGGAGYIGAQINKTISEKGYKTVVLDNLIRGHRDFVQWGEFVEGSIGDESLLQEIFIKFHITDVIHLAAFAYVDESVREPEKYWKNNFCESLALIKQCAQHGVERFVFSSTCATYGLPISIPITETHPQAPISPYGASKLAVEMAIRDFAEVYGFKFFLLRYFNAAGAASDCTIGERHQPETHIIPLALSAAYTQSRKFKIFGTDYETKDGTCVRDYVHVEDLAEAHALALSYLANRGTSDHCNVGLGRGTSVREIIGVVGDVTGRLVQASEMPRRVGDPPILIASNSKAGDVLNWSPKYTDIGSIVESAWRWHKKDWHE